MIKINKKKKGFTLVELLAVIVLLAIIILIAVNAVIPAINKSNKKALLNEARLYLNAGENAYAFDNNESVGRQCKSISDLNGEYVKKYNDSYSGVVITDVHDGVSTQTIHLTDGKYYIIGSGTLNYNDVKEDKPRGFSPTCGDYNPILFDDADENSLAHKLVMNEGGETFEENLAIIASRIPNLSQTQTDPEYSGMFKSLDDYGATYYYRGKVDNNWVSFGGFYWRIVRINGDGSIRMIYAGPSNSTHTGSDSLIGQSPYNEYVEKTYEVNDISGLSNNKISITGLDGLTYINTSIGYMYNQYRVNTVYPTTTLSDDNYPYNTLGVFPRFDYVISGQDFVLFKNFDQSIDCTKENSNSPYGSCILKCRNLGDPGDSDADCIKVKWNEYSQSADNYSQTAPGVYPQPNPTQFVYTSDYKYTCFDRYSDDDGYIEVENSDGTTSEYLACPFVFEIVGTVKNNPTKVRFRIHGLNSYDAATANINNTDSTLKKEVDKWYENNILNGKDSNNVSLENYLSDEIFCNDRTSSTKYFPFYGNNYVYYGNKGIYKNANSYPNSLKCPDKSTNGFTLSLGNSSSQINAKGYGNNALKYPIGLITMDEAIYAGGRDGANNNKYYLYNGVNYWTMSPQFYPPAIMAPYIYRINTSGKLSNNATMNSDGIRPVINLSPDVLYDSGTGTEQDPYTVKLSS